MNPHPRPVQISLSTMAVGISATSKYFSSDRCPSGYTIACSMTVDINNFTQKRILNAVRLNTCAKQRTRMSSPSIQPSYARDLDQLSPLARPRLLSLQVPAAQPQYLRIPWGEVLAVHMRMAFPFVSSQQTFRLRQHLTNVVTYINLI